MCEFDYKVMEEDGLRMVCQNIMKERVSICCLLRPRHSPHQEDEEPCQRHVGRCPADGVL